MSIYQDTAAIYTLLIKKELRVAMGCTEPIAIALCSAYAREVLGTMPQRYEIACSGNIIKNVKAVTVPNTDGLRGIEAAVIAGAVGGNSALELEVISGMTREQIAQTGKELEKNTVTVRLLETTHSLHIALDVYAGDDHVFVEIVDSHNGIGRVTKNGVIIKERDEGATDKDTAVLDTLSVATIIDYANSVDLSMISTELERQLTYNEAIANEGMSNNWGESVGKIMLQNDTGIRTRLKAFAAAGSDARMNGCALPVVINCGSGNQGITSSVPVLIYARHINASHDNLLRALCVSNLIALHQKTLIGRLSAYCGALSAATGSAAAIAYLDGSSLEIIENTIINSIANISGMVCDGAKSSCAAKIASSIECGLLGYDLARVGRVFRPGEGIVMANAEETIASVGRMAAIGMKSTDIEILNIMIGN